uniref:ATP synthase complex subunit 8 n=1 Tax=Xenagama taylori TaxID=330728 RepID=Q1G7J9_9SAUR|nr:ATP synthase F0 subunit 8 [Xenagama taylori]AAY57822.1 ATP synthase F0 subunit 8 [Xenagama taylori]
MPQLDMTNWFQVFMFTWLTLMVLLSKTSNVKFVTKPTKLEMKMKTQTPPW